MKNLPRVLSTCLVLVFASGAALTSTGCAGSAKQESTGEYLDNSAMTARVKSAFASDEVVKARTINVETFKGTVQLSGFVDTTAEKARAGNIAANIQGVKEVINNITVK